MGSCRVSIMLITSLLLAARRSTPNAFENRGQTGPWPICRLEVAWALPNPEVFHFLSSRPLPVCIPRRKLRASVGALSLNFVHVQRTNSFAIAKFGSQ